MPQRLKIHAMTMPALRGSDKSESNASVAAIMSPLCRRVREGGR